MKARTKEVREQTYGVLSDIDSVLEESRKLSASNAVWNGLFSGWDDEHNLRYATAWISFEAGGVSSAEERAGMSWAEFFDLRDNFIGWQSTRTRSGEDSTEGRNETELFKVLYDDTPNNYDAAAYSTAFTGEAPLVRMWYGDLIGPRREWTKDSDFQELVKEYERGMQLDER